MSAAAVVGHGSGTNQTCTEWGFKDGYNPCLYVDLVRLGIAFACISGCAGGMQGLEASSPSSDGDTAWNLAPICTSCTSGNGDLELLDIFGIVAGLGTIVVAAPFTGGGSLTLIPILLGAASAGLSGASLYEDMQSVGGSGLPNSGLSCGIANSSSIAQACPSYGWWDQTALPAGRWRSYDVGKHPECALRCQYVVAVIAQLQLGEVYSGVFGVTTNNQDYAQVNEVYLVNVNTV